MGDTAPRHHPEDDLPGWDWPLERFERPAGFPPEAEVQHPPRVRWTREHFVPACVDAFRLAGLDLRRACAATGPILHETGWGEASTQGNNFGGVKASAAWIEAQRKRTGKPGAYFRERGNRHTGDRPCVWYRCYPGGLADFCAAWRADFIPRPGEEAKARPGYASTGAALYSRPAFDLTWLGLLLQHGYRGENNVVPGSPGYVASVKGQEQLQRAALVRWCQYALGVVADGQWGARSAGACAAFQRAHGLPATGELTDATIDALEGAVAPREHEPR